MLLSSRPLLGLLKLGLILIICCGEALIDMVPVLSESGQTSYAPLVGGAIFNTAIGLGRLGVPVGMLSGVSTDFFGEQLTSSLLDSMVDTSYLIRSNAPTTLAFVTLTEGQASYTFYDENSAGRCVKLSDLPRLTDAAQIKGKSVIPTALYFGGISLINDPAAAAYCALAQNNAADMVIVLDPNIRTNFIVDEQHYRDALQIIIDVADIIKVSDEDLDWLVGDDDHNETQQVALLRGERRVIVVVTKGEKGATAYLASGETIHQCVPDVVVEDTVGAGDTFNAGFLAKLLGEGLMSKAALTHISSAQLLQALAYGAHVAGINVTRQGANPPWLSEL
jgi:fructokinase